MIENKKYIIFDLENTKVDSLLLADLKAYGYKMMNLLQDAEADEESVDKADLIHNTLNQLFHYKGHRKAQVVFVGNQKEMLAAAKESELTTIAIGFGENAVKEDATAEYIATSQEELRALLIDEAELQAMRAAAAMPKDGPTSTLVRGKTGNANGEKRTNAMAVVWKFLYPFLMFYFAGKLLESVFTAVLLFMINANEVIREFVIVANESTEELVVVNEAAYAIIQILKYVGGFLVAYFVLKGNKSIKKTQEEPKGFTTLNYISWTVLSVVFALGMNFLFAGMGWLQADTTYAETAGVMYGVSMAMGLILYGVVAPLTEEIMFRGVIFSELKNDLKPFSAAAISAALFGMYHGNIIQAVYGFGLGMMIAYAYHYSKRILAPILIHSVVNIVVFLCTNLEVFKKGSAQTTIGAVCTALGVLVLFYIVKTKEMNIEQED